jgi:hypothetical protein
MGTVNPNLNYILPSFRFANLDLDWDIKKMNLINFSEISNTNKVNDP